MSKDFDSVEERYPWIKHWSSSKVLKPYSEEVDSFWQHGLENFPRLDLYRSAFGKRKIKTVLEVGCGGGIALASIKKFRPNIFPIYSDLSMEMLETTRARLPDATLLRFDAHKNPFSSHSIDCVLCEDLLCSVLEYRHIFEELCRITKHVLMINIKVRTKGHNIADITKSSKSSPNL